MPAPRKKPASRKPKSTLGAGPSRQARRAAERREAKAAEQTAPPPVIDEQQTMAVALVPVGEDNQLPEGCRGIRGVVLALDETGTLSLLPVGIDPLMQGDIIRHAQRLHDKQFD